MLEFFLITLQAFRAVTLLIRNSNTGFFLCILQNFGPLVTPSELWIITMLNLNHTLENLRTIYDFNFTNFLSDRVMGCSAEGASYCCFHKAVSNNYFKEVLLITFISSYANSFQHFIFAHLIES